MRPPLSILLLCLLFVAGQAPAGDAPSVQVETAPLRQQAMDDIVSGYGVVSPEPRSMQAISLPRPGQIVRLLASAGQVVRRDTPLLEFSTGATAAVGYQQARHAVVFAQGEVTRVEQLVGQQLATQSQLAAARRALADAETALRGQESIGAGKALERVVAPFDGVVTSVQAAQGDRLAAGVTVLQLARTGRQRVLLGVEPSDVTRVHTGMSVRVNPVFSAHHMLSGRVAQVFGMINPQTQLVDVLVEIPGDGLMPGTRVRADIEISRQQVWIVPRSAVLRDARGAYLFQVVQGKAHRIAVQTGLEREGLVAVQGTFDPKQPVVTVGNYELQDDMAVRRSSP